MVVFRLYREDEKEEYFFESVMIGRSDIRHTKTLFVYSLILSKTVRQFRLKKENNSSLGNKLLKHASFITRCCINITIRFFKRWEFSVNDEYLKIMNLTGKKKEKTISQTIG